MQNNTENLIRQAKRRDADAFTELMQRYMENLYQKEESTGEG